VNLQQGSRRKWERPASLDLRHKAGQFRHHEGDKQRDQSDSRNGQNCRINQRLLDTITQLFRLHQVLDEPEQNLRQCATSFPRRYQIYVKRRKSPRELAQRLRETAAVD
jgi:hypothetical protein